MQVLDIIEKISDDTKVHILSENDNKVISTYDGKNNIESVYNNRDVLSVSVLGGILQLFI